MSEATAGPVTGDMRPLAVRFKRALDELTGRTPISERASGSEPQTESERLLGMRRRVGRSQPYRAAEVSRLLADFMPTLMAVNTELRGDLRRLRARGRDLSRNNAHVGQYLNLLTTNVLGPNGMDLQAQIRDANGNLLEDINEAIERGWKRYACEPVSADGTMALGDFSPLVLETTATDGEAFVRLVEDQSLNEFGLALQMIDADIVDDTFNIMPDRNGAEIRLGIEVDRWGRRQAYHLLNQPGYTPGDATRLFPRERVPASEMLHLFRPSRPNQTRGVTWFTRSMLGIQYLAGYTESELVAARTAAAKMGFIVTKDPAAAGAPPSDDDATVAMEANPGSIEELDPGQEFQGWDPTHPSTAFGDFTKSVLRQIATGLGVSYNALANDLENVNYSSIRSGMLIERDLWKMLHKWWQRQFLTPVYRRWLNSAILTGNLRLPRADWRLYTDIRWQARGFAWVDPKNDAEGAQLLLELGLTSHSRLTAETGADFAEIQEERAADQKVAKANGVTIMPEKAPAPAAQPPPPSPPSQPDTEDTAD